MTIGGGASFSTVVVVLPMVHPIGEATLRERCRAVKLVSDQHDEIASVIGEANALIARGPAFISDELLARGRELRVLSASGAGYDCIDIDAASRRGLPVLYAPGIGAPAVAEWVLGALVVAGRRFPVVDHEVRNSDFAWSRRTTDMQGVELRGKILGLIGLGNIGRRVARLAELAFEMQVIAYDPAVAAPLGGLPSVRLLGSVNEVLQTADFISVHVPLIPSTRGLIGIAELARIKAGASLINAARGGIVDEAAVADALRSGRLRFAAFDVFAGEPKMFESPLADAPNCMMSPHVAGLTDRAMEDLAREVAEGVVSALDGRIDPGRVANPGVLSVGQPAQATRRMLP